VGGGKQSTEEGGETTEGRRKSKIPTLERYKVPLNLLVKNEGKARKGSRLTNVAKEWHAGDQ